MRTTIDLEWGSKRIPILGFILLLLSLTFIQLIPQNNLVFLKGVIGWVVLFLLPGFLLVSLIFDEKLDLGELIPLSFGLSLAMFSLVGFLAYVLRWPIMVLFAIILLEIIGLLIWLFIVKKKTAIVMKNPKVIFLLLIGITFSVLLFKIGVIQLGDTITHLTWIRRLFERGIADPSVFGLLPDGGVWAPYAYDSWHLAIALVARVAKVDPIYIWINLASILVIVFSFSFWLFAKLLFKSERIAFAVTLFYILLEGIYKGVWIWRLSPYPDQIGKFLLVVGLFLAFKYIFNPKRQFLLLAILAAFALPLIHISSFTYFYLLLMLYAVFSYLFKEKRVQAKRAFTLITVGLLGTIPILSLKLFHLLYTPPAGIAFRGGFETEEFIKLPFNMYIVNYHGLFSQSFTSPYLFLYYILIFALLPLALLNYWKGRKPWAIFLSAGLVGTVFYIFNPVIVTPIITMLNGNLVSRAGFLIPFLGVFLVGVYIFKLLEYLEKKLPRLRYEVIIITLFLFSSILITFFLPNLSSFRYARTLSKAVRIDKYSEHLLSNMNKFAFVKGHTPEESVILSSGRIGASLIGPYFDRYPLPPRGGRLGGVEKVLDLSSEVSYETLMILDRYQVGYILTVNPLEASKLNEYPAIFREVCIEEGYGLYEVLTTSPAITSDYHLKQGVIALEEGDLREAGASFSKAVRLNPESAMAREQLETLGFLYIEQGMNALEEGALAEAARAFTGAIELDPENLEAKARLHEVAQAYFTRAVGNLSVGDMEAAFFDLRGALAIEPTFREASAKLEELIQSLEASQEAELVALSNNYGYNSSHDVEICYTVSRTPDHWNPDGTELVDGGWDSIANSIAWRLEGGPIAIDFDLKGVYPLHKVTIKNTHFTQGYGQGEWRILVLASEDGSEFFKMGKLSFERGKLSAGEHTWSFNTYRDARYVRVLVEGSAGLITLGEVEIWGYVFPQ